MSGNRVLLAWELGGNLGHLARMLALAKQIEEAGDEPIWALPAHAMESPYLRHIGHQRIQVPPPIVVSDKVDLRSYASILLNIGLANPAGAAHAVLQWRRIHEQVRPNRIVLDTAPMAQLAAYLYRWPVIRVSNGFDAPPAECPSFGIRMRGPYIDRLNAQHVTIVDAALVNIAGKLGVRDHVSLADYLTHPRHFFDCIPETDPYRERSGVTYVGPLNALPALDEPLWPAQSRPDRPKVFAYLRAGALTKPLLNGLVDLGQTVLCVSGGERFDLPDSAAGDIRITHRPVNLASAVQNADLVASYAPLGLLTQARVQAKPQLLVPTDFEKLMAARRLQASGAAVVIQRADTMRDAIMTAAALDVVPVRWSPPARNWMYWQ